jgi:hypothetical protein
MRINRPLRSRRPTAPLTVLIGVGVIPALAACAAEGPGEALDTDTAPALGPADGLDLPGTDLERIQVGDEAPDFTLASFGGGTVTLSDYRGESNVLLVFYRGHW